MKIPFDGIYNLRDMGGIPCADGKTVKYGMLYRSSLLATASARDIAKLESMNIRRIFDLRTEREQAEQPDPVIRGAEHITMPPVPDITAGITRDRESERQIMADVRELCKTPDDAVSYMINTYTALIREPSSLDCYARFIHMLAQPGEGAVLWHCFGGKDRAGFAALIVLSALGADRDTVIDDYLYTNECSREATEATIQQIPAQFRTETGDQALRALFAAKPEYISVLFDTIDHEYGGTDNFLRTALHLTADERNILKEMYLA